MDLSRMRGWVFDLDGTLTVPVHDFDAIREELGLSPGQAILEQLACMPERVARPLRSRLAGIEEELARGSSPSVGAVELVTELAGRGDHIGLLTRNTRANALLTLEALGLTGFFEVRDVLGREEAPPKPSPVGLHSLLGRWGVCHSEAVMVGDYMFDLEAGRRAGTWTVHVDQDARCPWPELTDLSVRTLAELIQVSRRTEPAPDISPRGEIEVAPGATDEAPSGGPAPSA